MNKLSRRRLKENEVIFREVNKDVQEFVEEEEGIDTDRRVPFYCECSRTNCRRRIEMTPQTYRRLHKNKKQFIVLLGHEISEIEEVVKTDKNIHVVEKYGEVPDAEDINLALRTLKT